MGGEVTKKKENIGSKELIKSGTSVHDPWWIHLKYILTQEAGGCLWCEVKNI